MMRRTGGGLLVVVGVALIVAQSVYASDRSGDSFDALVKGLRARYAVQPKSIPLLWMANLCARGVTHGGVRGMRVVEFEDSPKIEDAEGFEELVNSKLGEDWSRVVREWEASGNRSLIYVRAQNKGIEMIVVDLEHGELDLVKLTMNPEQFAKWAKDKGHGVGFQ
jgi:hypothetical protein